jgi:hypothetical protein
MNVQARVAGGGTPSSPTKVMHRLFGISVVLGIVAASIVYRLQDVGAPFVHHDFRQTQTAITIHAFLERGVKVFTYETPVFGPPWLVPFEFPTFQLTVYPIARLGVPLDVACRLVALTWFYVSAALLFLLVRIWAPMGLAAAALVAYVANPFTVVWSRAALIDYASVALCLGWVLATSWWARVRDPLTAIAATAVGALACMTKITTTAAYAPALIAVLLAFAARRSERAPRGEWRNPSSTAWIASVLVLPLAAGISWTAWADHVKRAAPATAWLTSDRLASWNFGTLSQRMDLSNWVHIFHWIPEYMFPGLVAVTIPVGLVAAWRRGAIAGTVLLAAAGALLAPLTFFNLFSIHDYYLIAVTPLLAVLAGAGFMEVRALLPFPGRTVVLAALVVIAAERAPSRLRYRWYVQQNRQGEFVAPMMRVARKIEATTPPDRWVVIEGDDWSPRLLYWARRRGFMVRPPQTEIGSLAQRPEWGTLVCKECPPGLLDIWPARRLVGSEGGFQIYQLASNAAAFTQ